MYTNLLMVDTLFACRGLLSVNNNETGTKQAHQSSRSLQQGSDTAATSNLKCEKGAVFHLGGRLPRLRTTRWYFLIIAHRMARIRDAFERVRPHLTLAK